MKFEQGKTYWCIKTTAPWVVKPWEGNLHISYNTNGDVYSLYPVNASGPFDAVHGLLEDSFLFHTKAEAKAAYIKVEVARLGGEKIRIAEEILELAGYKYEI